jgi:hypothetical protein
MAAPSGPPKSILVSRSKRSSINSVTISHSQNKIQRLWMSSNLLQSHKNFPVVRIIFSSPDNFFVVEKNPDLDQLSNQYQIESDARQTSWIGLLHLVGEALGDPGWMSTA